jgi:hypothetical protein
MHQRVRALSRGVGMGVEVGLAIEERVGAGCSSAAIQKVREQVLSAARGLRAGAPVVAGFE